jgi:DUF2927 family protein
MSRLSVRAAFSAVFLSAFVAMAGCSQRPSANDYSAFVEKQIAKGNLRTETAPPDAPYDAADLERNFERIALYHESNAKQPGSEDNRTRNPLQRWSGPLYYGLFGKAVTPEDRAEVAWLMGRIAELTGLEVAEAEGNWNFLILITEPDEREVVNADLAKLNPTLAATFGWWQENSQLICVANNLFSTDDRNVIAAGLVVIGSEVTGLLRRACLQEEIVQALGLANDHPDVRPSIFNDDGEFALLTEHDERLLRILYDPRLETGMTAAEAMPVVRQIIAEIPLDQPPIKLTRNN